MTAAQQPEPGARVGGKYKLVRRLASGGMGEVWVARNQATGADVAIKLCGRRAANEDVRLRFRHEARLGATLSHRSIVRTFDLVEGADGTLLLVMELLRGETLERYLKAHGPLPPASAIAIALPVLSALAHAHDFGVVHRDVTPANVFLAVDPDGHVIPKLVDFGIAKAHEGAPRTLDGRVLGTPQYMSPEQIRGQGAIDGRSDLFSVGVVLYEMMTGVSPFARGSPAACLAEVLEGVVDPDPRLEPALWFEIQRALSKRAYERHGSAREMAEALRAACGETDASLADLLQHMPPPRLEAAPTGAAPPTRSVGGHSLGYTGAFIPRRRAAATWIAGGVLFAGSIAVVTATVRATRANSDAGPTAATTTTAMTATVAATTATGGAPVGAGRQPPGSSEPAAAPRSPGAGDALPSSPPASAESIAPPPAAAAARPRLPVRVHRPKPVATTPGF